MAVNADHIQLTTAGRTLCGVVVNCPRLTPNLRIVLSHADSLFCAVVTSGLYIIITTCFDLDGQLPNEVLLTWCLHDRRAHTSTV